MLTEILAYAGIGLLVLWSLSVTYLLIWLLISISTTLNKVMRR